MNNRTKIRDPKFARSISRRSPRAWLLRSGALVALGSAAGLALVGCDRAGAEMNASVTAPRVVRVVQIDASRHGTEEATHYTGVIRARTESNLGFRVAGKIAERLVNAGDLVKKDQPLLKLDPVDYQLALESARAAVEVARAADTQARLELERVRGLVDKRAESRDLLEKMTAAADSSAAQLRSAEAQANQFANQASYTTLVSDSAGIVMTTLGEPGQVVAAGQPVVALARDGLREAAVDIPESSLEQIRAGVATASLYLDPSVTVPATLREISGVADLVARTYQARYALAGDPSRFPLGATVTVRVSSSKEAALTHWEIPLGSLIDRGEGAAVWVVDPGTSAVRKRPVSIAELGAETASISQGLEQGDLVVSNTDDVVQVEELSAKEAR